MFDKLFESLDEKVFTPELKRTLEVQFNEAVETKAAEIAEVRIDEEIERLNEKSEEHIEFLNKKADEYVEMQKSEMVEALDKYLDRVIDEFVLEASDSLDESVKSKKADMLIEAFESFLIATGVKIAQIEEAKNSNDIETKLTESVEKYDELIEENIALKEENEILIKLGVINELTEGLSIVESEKFRQLAELVEFSKDSEFVKKLEVIKNNVKGSKKESEEKLNEDNGQKPIWAHLV